MKLGIIGGIAGLVLSHCGIHIQDLEWWAVMACIMGAFIVGVES